MFLKLINNSDEVVSFQYDTPEFYWVTLQKTSGTHLFAVKLTEHFCYEVVGTDIIYPKHDVFNNLKINEIRDKITFEVVSAGIRTDDMIPLLKNRKISPETGLDALATYSRPSSFISDDSIPVWNENSYHNL